MIGNTIGAIGNIAGAVARNRQSQKDRQQSRWNVERTIQGNRELAEYAYSKDLDMWNQQNYYNSPQAQMERLKEAGLNPNMVYGSGSATGNTSGTMPEYNAPREDYTGMQADLAPGNVIGEFQNFQLRSAQIDNVKAQVDATKAQTRNTDIDTINKNLRNPVYATEAAEAEARGQNVKEYEQYNLQARELENQRLNEAFEGDLRKKALDNLAIAIAKEQAKQAKQGLTLGAPSMWRSLYEMANMLGASGKWLVDHFPQGFLKSENFPQGFPNKRKKTRGASGSW